MRKSIFAGLFFVMASLVAFGQEATPSDPGQDRQDLKQLNQNATETKQDARSTQNEMQQARSNLQTAIKDGNKAKPSKNMKHVHQDEHQLNQNNANIKKDQ